MHDLSSFATPTRRNPLLGLTPYAGRVAIYVPTTCHDEPAPKGIVQSGRDRVATAFAEWFGGYTELTGTGGYWSDKENKLIRETVFVVFAFADPALVAAQLGELIALAKSLAVDFRQECVTVEVGSTAYLVPHPLPAWMTTPALAGKP